MELLLKNVNEEHLTLLTELAKTLHFEVTEAIEDDAFYLKMMDDVKDEEVLSDEESDNFISSLKLA